ncbi:MAG: STAS domain-containing protein [Burkholderiales bacterium]
MAAVLFAEDRIDEALALLTHGIAGQSDEALWRMALDLFRLRADKQAFQHLAKRWVAEFSAQPPPWDPLVDEAKLLPDLRLGAKACVELGGDMDLTSAIGLNRGGFMERTSVLRVDATCLRTLDRQACSVLFDTLNRMIEGGIGIYLTGIARLIHCLRGLIAHDVDYRPAWGLLLLIARINGDEQEHTRVSQEYSVAFGAWPAEWEPLVSPVVGIPDIQEKRGEPRYQTGPEVLRLSGTLLGERVFHLAELQTFALTSNYVNIDLSHLHRMDVAAARSFVNVCDALVAQGKVVRVLRQHSLVMTLLQLLEINPMITLTALTKSDSRTEKARK